MTDKSQSLAIYGWLSIAAALVTIALKSYAYWLTGSVGLLSDALESLINLVAAVIVLIVLSIAARPPDDGHAYGHEKIEYFSSGAEGIMILLAAVSIAFTAWERLWHPQPLQQLDVGIAISVLASLINLIVARILIGVGRRRQSITLEADGKHLMTDVWTTVGILVGIALIVVANRLEPALALAKRLGMSGWEILDPIIAIAVALHIVLTGLHLIRRTVSGLMDAALPAEELAEIVAVLEQFVASERIAYHALRTRYAGARRFMSVHVLVPGDWSVQRGHDLLETIERQISQRFDTIDIDTHLEPIEDAASWRH
ncbi:cation diffusion facilitator family transporter [Methylomonas rapida]|uniref:Cation diffusion facilitator family transporter n=1 Tax=Methylomonas rapida TaxID=2963939 RepID=A0ABY7GK84_9GAMM|nr:cation diffusion facilitator family transporter [Methylomonas rapida]WAR44338.1 cation diffusion facilitator family transporter [Methylomonas rapida]